MGQPTRYGLRMYGRMITSEPRMASYAEALKQAITPGCTLFDIGAGPGVFSLLAAKLGAGRVVAIEPDDSVELLRDLAEANGCLDRLEIFKGLSTDYSPPAKADVIVSDIRGASPLFEHHIAAIRDARERLLAPGGTLIPSRDTIWMAIAECPEVYSEYCEEPWLRNHYELDLSRVARLAVNIRGSADPKRTKLLSSPAVLTVLDYYTISEPDFSGAIELMVTAEGSAHGLLMWFDSELAAGVSFSNAPDLAPQIYGQVFFPLERPLSLATGDRLLLEMTAKLIDGEYVWSWNSSLYRAGFDSLEVGFRQSTFLGKIISPASLRTHASSFVPEHSEMQEVDKHCLTLIDGHRTLGELAEIIHKEFPNHFGEERDALNHVTRLTERYR